MGCRLAFEQWQSLQARSPVSDEIVDESSRMQIERLLHAAIVLFQGRDKLLRAVARLAVSDHETALHVYGGTERGEAVAHVVVVMVAARAFFIGRPGCMRSSA
jgi:hypothetical protein